MQPKHIQVSRSTIGKLREMYQERWSREWPESDDYLRTLWRESRHDLGNYTRGLYAAPVFQWCLDLMRECHVFECPPPVLALPAPAAVEAA